MAHLTKYNLGRLCQKLEIKNEIDLQTFLDNIYDDPEIYYTLNRIELEYLFKYKLMLEDENSFFVEYYKEVPEKEDTKTLVFNKGGKMKYHLTSECKLLKKDYLDFNIPDDIQNLGNQAVSEYRNWFANNNFAERYKQKTIDKSVIINAFNDKYSKPPFNIKKIVDNSNLLIIDIPNSNIEYLEKEFNKKKLIKEINELKKQWQNVFQCKVSRKFSKFKHLIRKSDEEIEQKIDEIFTDGFTKNYGIKNLKDKFRIAKKINYQIIYLLLDYIRWTYNANDKDFNSVILEKFGLECCNSCLQANRNSN